MDEKLVVSKVAWMAKWKVVQMAKSKAEKKQAKRMKELEKENTRLKRLVAELSLDKQVLKDIASGNL